MARKKRIFMIQAGERFLRMDYGNPLGLLVLISILRKHYPGEFEIEFIHQVINDMSIDRVKERMLDFRPDLVCISGTSVEAVPQRRVAAASKQLFPDVPVWMGGPHATIFYDLELANGNVDAVCIGEGEQTFIEMIDAWQNHRPLDDIPGLALVRGGQVVKTAPREPILDLDSLPLPAWDLIDFDLYAKRISMNGFVHSMPWAMLFTSRACPFQCVYCHSIFGKKVRYRSIENVMKELELLVNTYGVKEIHIVDDIFNLDLERAKKICDEIVARGLKIKIAFPNGLRGDRMDRELIQKLKAAGCYSIHYAIETGSPRMQKKIKKNLDLEKLKQVIEWTDAEGIIAQAFTMLGLPGETREEMQMTVDYCIDSRLLFPRFFTAVAYPRTGLYDLFRQEYPELELDPDRIDFESFFYFAENPFYSRVTGEDLFRIQRDAYRAFFLRPSIVWRIFWRFPKNRWFVFGIYWAIRSVFSRLIKLDQYVLIPLKKYFNRRFELKKSSPTGNSAEIEPDAESGAGTG